MNPKNVEYLKFLHEIKKQAIKSITECYHPGCLEKSINSHILQKNGILSKISTNNHLWELTINEFNDNFFVFKKKGLNEIFSFKCFCKKHDDSLFKKIETGKIDFNDYESCLLFTLRTIYNEIYKKQVNIKVYHKILDSDHYPNENKFLLKENIKQEKLGIHDLENNLVDIWQDLNNKTKNFHFASRKLKNIDICLSAFYNYETTYEMNVYRLQNGKDMERISEIFINFFPYENNSILLMGYNLKDEKKLKPYFNTFFKESEKRVQRKLSNLILFGCENWIVSEKIYNDKFSKIKDIMPFINSYTINTHNERTNFNINLYKESFTKDIVEWYNKHQLIYKNV